MTVVLAGFSILLEHGQTDLKLSLWRDYDLSWTIFDGFGRPFLDTIGLADGIESAGSIALKC